MLYNKNKNLKLRYSMMRRFGHSLLVQHVSCYPASEGKDHLGRASKCEDVESPLGCMHVGLFVSSIVELVTS